MSDAIALHNALREHQLLPQHLDLKFSQCPMKHCELMESLEEELGIGYGETAAELQIEVETLEQTIHELRDELAAVEKHEAELRRQYLSVCKELETMKASATQ